MPISHRDKAQCSTLITGAASGIGRAFSEALAAQRHDLVLIDRNEGELADLAQQLSQQHRVKVTAIPIDLSRHSSAKQIRQRCREQGIRVSMLINNAGMALRCPLAKQSSRSIAQMIEVNVGAVVRMTRAFLPPMLKRGSGTIVNVSSISAFEASPWWAVYAGTKSFVQNFTMSLQGELEGTRVRAVLVCPGITRTPFLKAAGLSDNEIPDSAQTPRQVVDSVLRGVARGQLLIVPGRRNWLLVWTHHASLRSLAHHLLAGLRRVRGLVRRSRGAQATPAPSSKY